MRSSCSCLVADPRAYSPRAPPPQPPHPWPRLPSVLFKQGVNECHFLLPACLEGFEKPLAIGPYMVVLGVLPQGPRRNFQLPSRVLSLRNNGLPVKPHLKLNVVVI